MKHQIPCPDCNAPIFLEMQQLLAGQQFCCANCNAVLSLSVQSRPLVADTMAALMELKQQTARNRGDGRDRHG